MTDHRELIAHERNECEACGTEENEVPWLQGEVTRLTRSLARYGRHDYSCSAIRFDGITPPKDPSCDCGLAAELEAP